MITITPTPQQFTVPPPPPVIPNMSVPPPGHRFPPPQRFHPPGRHTFFQQFRPYGRGIAALDPEFDGKRLRKSAMRKTVDYNSSIIKMIEGRVWQRDFRDRRALQPDTTYIPDLLPPPSYEENAINAVTTRFVKTATNKMRCPVFCMAWTPEGRRLITGASSGEFTLWNGLTFNFETILQAHDSPVRTMVWSHNDVWMVTADHTGYVKYWQSNMNSVKVFLAHKEAIRGISFSPNDSKFATCSDDGTIRIWDFLRCHEERILRGHGADVKCVHWHPQKGLVVSGSKDNQQPVKLWDPKTGQSLATLHAHKSTVMDVKWNKNGNWLVTASRDHLLKLFDIRNLSSEVQTFRGHKKESSSVAWHPQHEGLFCSGGSDGAILFWHVGADKEVGAIEQAHDSIVWTLAWHPLGHILCSGSNDHTSKFWTRNRPGDQMRDKYNLNTLPASLAGLDENDIDDYSAVIPGMGPEDKVEVVAQPEDSPIGITPGTIPGLDIDSGEDKNKATLKKVPYSKPIPKNFQAQWNETGRDDAADDSKETALNPIAFINSLVQDQPGVKHASEIDPDFLFMYNRVIPVKPGTPLCEAIHGGIQTLVKYVHSGAVAELRDVIPYYDLSDNENQYPVSDDDDDLDEDDGLDEDRRRELRAINERLEAEEYNDDKNSWRDHDDRSEDMQYQGMNMGGNMPPSLLGAAPHGGPPPLMGGFSGQGDNSNSGSFIQQPQNMFMSPNMMGGNKGSDMYRSSMDLPPNMQQDMFRSSSNKDNGDNIDDMHRGSMQGNFRGSSHQNMGGDKPPPLLPPEEVQRFREMHRNKDERSSKKGRGGNKRGGGFNRRSGGGKFGGGNRSLGGYGNNPDYDDEFDDDDDRDMDRRNPNDEDMRNYNNGDYSNRGSRHWDDERMPNDEWQDEDMNDDDNYDEEGQIDDRHENQGNNRNQRGGNGGGGRFNFNRGKSFRNKRSNKSKRGFDKPWKGGNRGGGGGGGRGGPRRSPMKRGGKSRGRGGGGGGGRGRSDRDRNRD